MPLDSPRERTHAIPLPGLHLLCHGISHTLGTGSRTHGVALAAACTTGRWPFGHRLSGPDGREPWWAVADRLNQPHGPGTARGADLTHDVHDTADSRHNFGHGGPGFIHQGAALPYTACARAAQRPPCIKRSKNKFLIAANAYGISAKG